MRRTSSINFMLLLNRWFIVLTKLYLGTIPLQALSSIWVSTLRQASTVLVWLMSNTYEGWFRTVTQNLNGRLEKRGGGEGEGARMVN